MRYSQRFLHEFLVDAIRDNESRPLGTDEYGSYVARDLLQGAERLSAILKETGLRAGDRVVVRLEPSLAAAAALCAITSGGMVFVPVSPETPVSRAQAISQQAEASAELVRADEHDDGHGKFGEVAGEICCAAQRLVLRRKPYPTAGAQRPLPRLTESSTAYIVFTSGTTGEPKGIAMSHGAAVAFLAELVRHCALGPGDIVGSFAPIQFDFWLLDLGLALGSGAQIAFLPRHLTLDPRAFARELRGRGVTQLNGVPSMWLQMLRYAKAEIARNDRIRSTLFAGDHFPASQIRELQALIPGIRIVNCFGQSESIASTFHDLPNPLPPEMEVLPIGTGHEGVQYILVDEHGQVIVQPNVAGEIYVRAVNLFSGYWRDAAATSRALIENPLAPGSGERVFRSGDRAYFDARGIFYYLGRLDDQVQVRGNRVELQEIARCAECFSRVIAALPHLEGEEGAERIALSVKADGEIDVRELKSFLRERLPSYMMPTRIEISQDLEFTTNGKLSRATTRETPI